jgi:hypothetical protein
MRETGISNFRDSRFADNGDIQLTNIDPGSPAMKAIEPVCASLYPGAGQNQRATK